jgi:nucleoside-diphosphate-sugar epimerase
MASKPLLREDLDHVLAHTESLWREMAGTRVFITGGTGFFGKWLLECMADANDRISCNIRATILSRNPQRFKDEMPHLAERAEFDWLIGDVTNFAFPEGHYDYIFHMATSASAQLNDSRPLEMLDTIVNGTRRTLEFARHCNARRLLLTSSGAVYGPQPSDMSHIPEDYLGGPDPLSSNSAYAEGKRMAELLCTLTPEVECVTARCFAFIGPHLPLDAHFAAGNFLRDALEGGPIRVQGDGRTVRSYLYAADLMIWLLTLLLHGQSGRAYNVGSDEAISTGELAKLIAGRETPVTINGTANTAPIHRYLPATMRSREEHGLVLMIGLECAIARTLNRLRVSSDANTS